MKSIKTHLKAHLPTLFSILSRIKGTFRSLLVARQKKSLPGKIARYHADDSEKNEIISFLSANPPEMIPYAFRKEYESKTINVSVDPTDDLYVVVVKGKSIYFPKTMTREYVEDSVRTALLEQDERSPHRYPPTNEIALGGDVAVLCGASDGIYALDIIDSFKKIYLFEANPAWVKPIQKTLRDYLGKVEIVPYFVSDHDGEGKITLDSFFAKKGESVNYIQADIEGDELKMLKGAKGILQKGGDLKLTLCCYHTQNQERELTEYLTQNGFMINHSEGFLLLWMQYPLKPPYLRRGVLYAMR